MEGLAVNCPLCEGEMSMNIDLINETVNFFCDCLEYTRLESVYMNKLLEDIEKNQK